MKNNKRRLSKLIALAACAAMVLSLAACGGSKEAAATEATEAQTEAETTTKEETTTPAETTTAAPEYDEIGEKDDDAVSFEMTNKTGQDIKSITVTTSEDTEASENLIAEDDTFEKSETCVVYLDAEDADDADSIEDAEDAEDAGEKLVSTEYTLTLLLADDTEIVLHSFPVNDIKSGEVMVNDGIGYLVYESLGGEKNISTLEAEKAIAEAAAAPAVEETVAEEPVYEEPVYEEPVYEEPVYEEPVYEEPAYVEPAGDDDACIGDGGMTW